MRILKVVAIIACSLLLVGWSFGTKKPKVKELEVALKKNLPEHVKLDSFDADVLENMGNKINPQWGSRFKAVVTTKEPLYSEDKNQNHKMVLFILLKNKKGTKTDIFGTVTSTIYQDKWKHSFQFDGNPLQDLGESLNQIKGEDIRYKRGKPIIRGSKEEERLTGNFTNVSELLIGTWLTVIYYDGTLDTIGTVEFTKDGKYTIQSSNSKSWHTPPQPHYHLASEVTGEYQVQKDKVIRKTRMTRRIEKDIDRFTTEKDVGPWRPYKASWGGVSKATIGYIFQDELGLGSSRKPQHFIRIESPSNDYEQLLKIWDAHHR